MIRPVHSSLYLILYLILYLSLCPPIPSSGQLHRRKHWISLLDSWPTTQCLCVPGHSSVSFLKIHPCAWLLIHKVRITIVQYQH